MLLQRGYKITDLYDMTFGELKITLEQSNKGLAYQMWRQANLIGCIFGEFPQSPEQALPELYPPKKSYVMPDFLKEKAIKRGVI